MSRPRARRGRGRRPDQPERRPRARHARRLPRSRRPLLQAGEEAVPPVEQRHHLADVRPRRDRDGRLRLSLSHRHRPTSSTCWSPVSTPPIPTRSASASAPSATSRTGTASPDPRTAAHHRAQPRLIGAGVRSAIRTQTWGVDNPVFSGMVTWRGVVPMGCCRPISRRWSAAHLNQTGRPRRHLSCGGKLLNFVATIDPRPRRLARGGVEHRRHRRGMRRRLRRLAPRRPRGDRVAPKLFKWALMVRDRCRRAEGRDLGDAATRPCTLPLAQGAVMAIEDGVIPRPLPGGPAGRSARRAEALLRRRVRRTRRWCSAPATTPTASTARNCAPRKRPGATSSARWSKAPIATRYHWLYTYKADGESPCDAEAQ